MGVKSRQSIYLVTALFLVAVFVLGGLHGCKRQKPEAGTATPVAGTQGGSPSAVDNAANLFREPKAGIQNIVNAAKERWMPRFEGWWGKLAPDFALLDLDGQTHKLSDYRGKEIVVVFWDARVGGCKMEIPHLKDLRSSFGPDKLAILAITQEPPAVVKDFVAAQGINYTVLLRSDTLPAPYNEVKNVPSSLFIGADGRFKVATEGMIPATDAKAIVQAQ